MRYVRIILTSGRGEAYFSYSLNIKAETARQAFPIMGQACSLLIVGHSFIHNTSLASYHESGLSVEEIYPSTLLKEGEKKSVPT